MAQPTNHGTGNGNNGKQNKRDSLIYCRICQADMTLTGFKLNQRYCQSCARKQKSEKLLKARNKYYAKRRFLKTAKQQAASVQYLGQINSSDNHTYIISQGNGHRKISKVCGKCGHTDGEVYGKWGPIYSEFDDDGSERVVLLCLLCYEAEMEKFN